MENLEGQSLGKYDVLGEIGRGNMARVYFGRDTFTGRDVAIKVADPTAFKNNKAGRRRRKLFFNEARAAGLLKHPNIAAIYDAGVEEQYRYIVMEFVPGGKTLHNHIHPDTLLPMEEVVEIVVKCAVAFDYAHRKGVIHRDVKPRNILLVENHEIKIVDFGVALITGDEAADTQVLGYLGSPLYMSPEQVRGETITNQSDVFSLGVVMYEMLTGQHPFIADTVPAITHKISHEAHVPLRELRPDLPPVLDHVIERTLKKHPAGRYNMGIDLAGDLSLVFDHIRLAEEDVSGKEKLKMVKDLEFFKPFEESEIWELINASVFRHYKEGDEVVSEGNFGSSYYVVAAGDMYIRRQGTDIDQLKAGDSFGEIAFLTEAARTASVIAKGKATVMELQSDVIGRTSMNCQFAFQKAFLQTMAARLTRAMELIYYYRST